MATLKLYGGGEPVITGVVPSIIPPAKLRRLSADEMNAFVNWIPSNDTKAMSSDLAKRGLVNASQLIEEKQPKIVTGQNSRAVQSSWKTAAILNILQKAREFGIRTPKELMANKDVLMQKEYKDAINHPMFKQIHPNFWEVVGSLYKERLDNENKIKK